MKQFIFLLLLSLYIGNLQAQNLVNNGGIEKVIKCPDPVIPGNEIQGYAEDWYAFGINKGGAMLNLDCFKPPYWYVDAFFDTLPPYKGRSVLVVPAFQKKNLPIRYYVLTLLTKPLVKDSVYSVEYFIHLNTAQTFISHFGATFIQDTLDIYKDGSYYKTNDYVGFRDTFLGPDRVYHRIKGCYKAKGGEKYLMFGCFLPDNEITWSKYIGPFGDEGCAVLLDEVSVYPTSQVFEPDKSISACDSAVVTLPIASVNVNATILDFNDQVVTSTKAQWPNPQLFYYNDACFGEIGMLTLTPTICIDPININQTICLKESVNLQDEVGNDYAIYDASGKKVTQFTPDTTGYYQFACVHNKYGDFGTIKVNVTKCEKCNIFYPNVFSLNQSSINSSWKPLTPCLLENYSLSIYDRWGGLVWQTKDPDAEWNGNMGSKAVQSGVYVYMCQYRFVDPDGTGIMHTDGGDVMVIR